MSNITLLVISISACLTGGILKKYLGDKFENQKLMYQFFNAAVSLVSAISLFVMGGITQISVFTFLLGAMFGIITALQMIFSLKAYETGPFSYTTVIVALSTLIPTLSGHFIWGEPIAFVQIIGIVLMVVCMICSVDFNTKGEVSTKASAKWFINVAIAFVCTGLIGILQKFHQNSAYKAELNVFLIIAFVISFVYSVVSFFVISSNQKINIGHVAKAELNPTAFIIIAICGICVALNNKINLYLSGVMDSAILFPTANGSHLILTAIASVILFKEKLSTQKWIGMAIGTIAVILLCNPF